LEHGCEECVEADNYDGAAKSCPRAQYWLSRLIKETNPKESLQLLEKSASQGYISAFNTLGCFYFNESKKDEDRKKAAELFIRASEFDGKNASRNAYLSLKETKPIKALWYLALACKNNNLKAKEDILRYIPKVIKGNRCEQLVEEQEVKYAEEGLSQYKEQSIEILLKRVQRYAKLEWYDKALQSLDRLEKLDENLAKQKREELEAIIPEWYYEQDDVYFENYSRQDSLMDALDGQPDAYWNID
jgi:TPR repeat protein